MSAKGTPDSALQAYLSAFEEFEASLNGGALSGLHARRRAAIARLAAGGLPTARDEAWRHTNPAPLARTFFAPAAPAGRLAAGQVEGLVAESVDGALLVFADGGFVPHLSRTAGLPSGLRVRGLAEAATAGDEALAAHLERPQAEGDGFAALNRAFARDGALIVAAAGTVVDAPVQVLYVATGGAVPRLTAPRTLVVAGAGCRLCVVETFAGGAGGLAAPVAEVIVGEGAAVEHARVHLHAPTAHSVGTLHVSEGRGCRFAAHTFCLGGQLVREEVTTVLGGDGIDSTLNGLFLACAEEHVDNYTTIEHTAPSCASHELYKGILGGRARGVFRGKIHVHRPAQKTDAYQSNQNLLLSDDAEVTSKPQLEIYADDVKCSHGSTTGQLDAGAIFYLRSRGIGRDLARRVLTRAFAGELVERVGHQALRAHLDGLVGARLDAVLADGGSP